MNRDPRTLEEFITHWFRLALKNPVAWVGIGAIAMAKGGLAGIPATLIFVPIASLIYGTVFGTIAYLGRSR